MIEFTIGDHGYRAEKLDAFQQWDVARRLLPVVGGAADLLVRVLKNGGKIESVLSIDVAEAIEPLAKALAAMPDADNRFVLDVCLSKVMRGQSGSWAPVKAPGGGLMFNDIDMPVMLQLVWRVVEHNLLSFSSAPAAALN